MKLQLLQCAALLLCANPVVAQRSADFVGTWELVSIEARTGAGEWAPAGIPSLSRPVGIIMYDDKGNMAVQITGNPRSQENPPDNPEIVNGYVAYYGTYDVDAARGTVTHHRRNHLNPESAPLSVVRHFEFDGDLLTLTVAPQRELRLSWRKVE